MAFSSTTSIAQDYILEAGKDYVFGDLTDVDYLQAHGVNSIVINSINSPSGLIDIHSIRKEYVADPDIEEPELNLSDIYMPNATINGDLLVGGIRVVAKATINSNLTAIADRSIEEYKELIDKASEEEAAAIGMGNGVVLLGGSEKRPIFVHGNITAPVVEIQSHSIYKDEGEHTYWGYTVVDGNVNAEYLFTDHISVYDDQTDYIEIKGITTVNRDFRNNGSAKLNKLIVNGTFYNGWGRYNGEGIDNPLELVGASIAELDALNIVNGSNLYVGKLTNDVSQTYTQNFGTIQVTDNWFVDSTINMSGGIINEDSLGPDKNLGINNVYNITGGTLIVGDLNFDSTVNLSQDGKIQTDIESIFINPDGDPEALNYVSMNASQPESVKASLTKWFTNYVAGTLRTDLEDHVNFNGGSIVVSGFGKITETQYDDLMDAFKEAFLYPVYPSFSIDNSQIQRGHFTFKNWGVEEF